MNHADEKQLVYYVSAHDQALEQHDEREAAHIRQTVAQRFNLRLLRDARMGEPRVTTL